MANVRRPLERSDTSATENSTRSSLLLNLAINGACPYLFYQIISTRTPPWVALLIVSLLPLGNVIYEYRRNGYLNAISIAVFLGLIAALVASFIPGDSEVGLLKIAGMLALGGLIFLGSLRFSRPLAFYLGRSLFGGTTLSEFASYNDYWQEPYIRSAHRLVTMVWGLLPICGALALIVLFYVLSGSSFLSVAPIVCYASGLGLAGWTLLYGWYAYQKGTRIRRDGLQTVDDAG